MKSVKLIGLAVFAISLLVAPLASAQGGNPPASTKESGATSGHGMTGVEQTYPKKLEAHTKDIDAVRKAWEDAYNAKDAAKVAALYTDDAMMADPGGMAQGKEQIRTALQKGIDAGETVVAITPTHTEVQGNLAFEGGTFQQKRGDQETHGNYLVVLKKVGGQWKLAAHNSVLPRPTDTPKEKKD